MRTEAGFHRVQTGDEIVVCRAPKRLLRPEGRTSTTAVVIGDRVRARRFANGSGVIEEILPRENELVRGATGGSRYLDVIAANIDLLVAVHSLQEPDYDSARLDRFIAMAEAAEIPALVVLNKVDLVDQAVYDMAVAPYHAAGYPVIGTCARTGAGIDDFRGAVTGKISAVVGPSGVGKSSLLNRLQPGLRLRTGEVSEATGKGRHTTTTAELLPLEVGGYIADTPGLGELAIREVEPEDVAWLFPEFREHTAQCRFADCTHRSEPGCAVRAMVAAGTISADRHRSYERIYDEVLERQKTQYD